METDLFPAILYVLKTAHPDDKHEKRARALELKASDAKSIKDQVSLHIRSPRDTDDKSRDDGDSSSASSEDPSLEDVLDNLKTDVEALVELGPRLKDPIQDTLVEAPAPPPEVMTDNSQAFFVGIKQKLPFCDDSLARALSKALYNTTRRLLAERQMTTPKGSNPPDLVSEPNKDSGYETGVKAPTHQADSFGENGIVSGLSYARTLQSYADADDGQARTPFPSQPKDLRIGDKFPCPACGRQVAKSEHTSAWKYVDISFIWL